MNFVHLCGPKKEKKKVWSLPTRLIFSLWIAAAQSCFFLLQSHVHICSDIFPNEDFILFYFILLLLFSNWQKINAF